MTWLQIHLDIDASNTDIAEQALLDNGAVSVTLQDRADQPILEPAVGETPIWPHVRATGLFADTSFNNDEKLNQLSQELLTSLQLPAHALTLEQLEDKNWEREWLSHFKPLRCGSRLWICPDGKKPPEPCAINMLLDPGLAFGTGTHETTMLCLEWLDQQALENKTIIDFGCGSGILGIAALLLGAKHVLFIDNDPQALAATQANLEKNSLTNEYYTLQHADEYHRSRPLKQKKPLEADLLIANILAKPLIELSPMFISELKTKGQIILSGILAEQTQSVMAAYLPTINFFPTAQRNDWICLTGEKC